jgi:hypothetical protein
MTDARAMALVTAQGVLVPALLSDDEGQPPYLPRQCPSLVARTRSCFRKGLTKHQVSSLPVCLIQLLRLREFCFLMVEVFAS